MKKLLLITLSLFVGLIAFAFTYNWVIDQMEYATDEIIQTAYVSSTPENSWALLDEDCAGIDDWVDEDIDTAVSEVSPAGQFRFDTNSGAAGNAYARRRRDIGSLPNTFTYEIKIYHDTLGTKANIDNVLLKCSQADETFRAYIDTEGLFIRDTDSGYTEVGTGLVKHGGSAEWQTWRFLVTFTGVTGEGTCDVYLKDTTNTSGVWEKVGTAIPCSREEVADDGDITVIQYGAATDDMVSHVDYIKIGTGLTSPPDLLAHSEGTIRQQGTYSLKGVATDGALNETLTRTLTGVDKKDLTNSQGIEYDIYALRTGSNIKIGIHDSGGTITEHTANVASSNTNQTESWDMSGVSDANKDDIDWIKITIVNADSQNTFYIDDIKWGITAVGGGSWTFVQ